MSLVQAKSPWKSPQLPHVRRYPLNSTEFHWIPLNSSIHSISESHWLLRIFFSMLGEAHWPSSIGEPLPVCKKCSPNSSSCIPNLFVDRRKNIPLSCHLWVWYDLPFCIYFPLSAVVFLMSQNDHVSSSLLFDWMFFSPLFNRSSVINY
jgi:hypothetical protein